MEKGSFWSGNIAQFSISGEKMKKFKIIMLVLVVLWAVLISSCSNPVREEPLIKIQPVLAGFGY